MKTRKIAQFLAFGLSLTATLGGCSLAPGDLPLNATGEAAGEAVQPAVGGYVGAADVPSDTLGTGQVLTVGIPFDYPGIGMMNDETGIPSGFAVDIAAYVAWKLGYSPYDIEWVAAPTAERVPMLRKGTVDLIVAPMSITAERAKDIDFAGPYLVSGQDILVRTNDTSINSKDDLAGKTLCEIPTSTGDARLRELFGNEVTIIYEDNYELCIRHLVNGEADAVSTDDAILAGQASSDEFYRLVRVVGKPFSEERYGIGLPNNSHSLCLQVNQALADMVEDGSWKKFIDRHVAGTHYFEDNYDNPPALEVCAADQVD